jgi:heme/copper-type cytochrome/quinol oxidase subunit 4
LGSGDSGNSIVVLLVVLGDMISKGIMGSSLAWQAMVVLSSCVTSTWWALAVGMSDSVSRDDDIPFIAFTVRRRLWLHVFHFLHHRNPKNPRIFRCFPYAFSNSIGLVS